MDPERTLRVTAAPSKAEIVLEPEGNGIAAEGHDRSGAHAPRASLRLERRFSWSVHSRPWWWGTVKRKPSGSLAETAVNEQRALRTARGETPAGIVMPWCCTRVAGRGGRAEAGRNDQPDAVGSDRRSGAGGRDASERAGSEVGHAALHNRRGDLRCSSLEARLRRRMGVSFLPECTPARLGSG